MRLETRQVEELLEAEEHITLAVKLLTGALGEEAFLGNEEMCERLRPLAMSLRLTGANMHRLIADLAGVDPHDEAA